MDATWLDTVMVDLDAWVAELLAEFEAEWQGERMEVMQEGGNGDEELLPQAQVYG